jgi:hypothetical protein
LFHDTDQVFESQKLLKSWGANLVMIAGLKGAGGLGAKGSPHVAKFFNFVRDQRLNPAGMATVWSLNHLAGLGGQIATTQLNQALGLSHVPKGGLKERLAHDVFTYIKYGMAQKGVDSILGKDFILARGKRQQLIRQKETELLASAKNNKPQNILTHPLLAPLWMMMGVEGGGVGEKNEVKKVHFQADILQDPKLREINSSLLALRDKNPEDPAIREHLSVMADRLAELGDSRGEWVALEVKRQELLANKASPLTVQTVENEISRIQESVEGDIKARFGLVVEYEFDSMEGGFQLKVLRGINPTDKSFAHFLQSEYVQSSIDFEIKDLSGPLPPEANLNLLKNLRKLKISNCPKIALEDISNLSQLESLSLKLKRIDPGEAQIIAENFPNLRSLNLQAISLGLGGEQAIADSKNLTQLQHLNLEKCYLDPDGATAIATSTNFANLKSLNLSFNHIGPDGRWGLDGQWGRALSQNFPKLESLTLVDMRIDDLDIYNIAEAKVFANLKSLDLGFNELSDEGLRPIFHSENFPKLKSLRLSENPLGDKSAQSIAKSENLSNLEALYLDNTFIGDSGARAIAESENFANLKILDLNFTEICSRGTQAIAQSKNLANLNKLRLHNEVWLMPEELRVIFRSSKFPRLIEFNGEKIARPGSVMEKKAGMLYSTAAPVIPLLETIFHGQPSLLGVLAAGGALLATNPALVGGVWSWLKGRSRPAEPSSIPQEKPSTGIPYRSMANDLPPDFKRTQVKGRVGPEKIEIREITETVMRQYFNKDIKGVLTVDLEGHQAIEGIRVKNQYSAWFYENGQLAATKVEAQTIQGISYEGGIASFHRNGQLMGAKLSAPHSIDGWELQKGDSVTFDDQGRLRVIHFANPRTFVAEEVNSLMLDEMGAVLEVEAASGFTASQLREGWVTFLNTTSPHDVSSKQAAFALAQWGDARSVPQLRLMLQSGDLKLRAGAAYFLGHLRATESVPDLLETIKWKRVGDAEARAEALRALEKIAGDPRHDSHHSSSTLPTELKLRELWGNAGAVTGFASVSLAILTHYLSRDGSDFFPALGLIASAAMTLVSKNYGKLYERRLRRAEEMLAAQSNPTHSRLRIQIPPPEPNMAEFEEIESQAEAEAEQAQREENKKVR